MKIAVVLLVLLPLALSVPIDHQKRLLLDSLFSGTKLKNLVSQLTHTLESDETEAQCESQCHTLIQSNHLLQNGCPLICRSLQSLAHRFGVHPDGTTMMPPTVTL